MPGPIKPSEVADKKAEAIPEAVFEVFNALIAENWDGSSATFYQDEAVKRIVSKLEVKRDDVFKRRWLDVESAYRRAGWSVDYDNPGFNESYPATFTFRKKSTRSF